MAASEGTPSHDTLGERGRSDPRVFRLLVTSNRAVLAAGFLLFVPAALLLGAFLHPVPFEYALVERAPIQGLYQALVISTVTGATLVLTLSQLILSEEFGPVGEQRRRMEEAVDFRHDLETLVSRATETPTPSRLMLSLVDGILARAQALEEAAASIDDPDVQEAIQEYLQGLREDANLTAAMLESSRFGTFSIVDAVLSFDLTVVLHETRHLRTYTQPPLPDEIHEALEDLEEALAAFGSARAHAKALYLQYELADLSRWIIYTSFPAIVVAVASLLYFDPTAIDSGWTALTIAAVTISIALTPFAILLSYVLRIVKISKVTHTRSPFLVRGG